MPPLSGTSPTVALLIVDSVPLAFGAAEEVAPSKPEPALAPGSEIVDLLALSALAL